MIQGHRLYVHLLVENQKMLELMELIKWDLTMNGAKFVLEVVQKFTAEMNLRRKWKISGSLE